MAESDAILHEGAACVRAARVHSLRHGCNAAAGGATIEGHFTANAAHFSSGPEWMPHAETPVRRRIYQRFTVRLVPLPLRQAIRRDDRLEKRSQNRLLKEGARLRRKKVQQWAHVTAKAIFPG
jgi:hypothetical protein